MKYSNAKTLRGVGGDIVIMEEVSNFHFYYPWGRILSKNTILLNDKTCIEHV